jgi:hypothetical protein
MRFSDAARTPHPHKGSSLGRRALPRLEWDQLTEDKIASIPLLGRLRPRQ